MARATLADWQLPPQHRWAYQHVREIVPTSRIRRGEGPAPPLPRAERDLSSLLAPMLERSWTDAFLLLHRGAVVVEHYETGMDPGSTHLMQSVSKSVCGMVAGILAERGQLDPDAPVPSYLAELAGGAWEGCTVRHLLDMRSGTRWTEDYTDPDADVRLYERVIGWAPPLAGQPPGDLRAYVSTLGNETEHGRRFVYRSILTDLLGLVIERAAGAPYAEVVSRELWSRLGAEQDADITVDSVGNALADGGMCASLRDLGRFGELVRVGGSGVIPAEWIDDTIRGDDECRRAWLDGERAEMLPDGHYRNQWWVRDPGRGVLMALGIHGQMIYVDRAAELVAVKLSTWPDALDDELRAATIEAIDAAGAALATT
jgi:CubicO group peptidase (beta-lactamase class C family)